MMPTPFLYETPADALQSLQQRSITLGDLTLHLTLPGNIDSLLDHPAIHSAFEADEYMPYWAEIWPAAQMLGKALMAETWSENMVALEIGCGLGLSGMVALSLGMHTIFSDYDAAALKFVTQNAQTNGFSDFETRQIDWRFPPNDLKVPLILAADVIYEARHIEPLVMLIPKLLLPNGECWLVDPDRSHAQAFRTALIEHRLDFDAIALQVTPPNQTTVQGTLYRIRANQVKG